MISESLKTNTTLTELNLGSDENEVNEQTTKTTNKKKKRKQRIMNKEKRG